MKAVLLIVGLIAILFGLHWIGQGTGYFIWPANPVMDNHIAWAYGGAAVAVLGSSSIRAAVHSELSLRVVRRGSAGAVSHSTIDLRRAN